MTRNPSDPIEPPAEAPPAPPGSPTAEAPPAAATAIDSPRRATIAERAARRTTTAASEEHLRYDHLLRHLREGREVDAGRRSPFALSLDLIHRNFWRVIVGVAIVLVVYLAALNVAGWLREGRVDTWNGLDASVTSGQRQPDCVAAGLADPFVTSPEFPTWIRYDGRLFGQTEAIWPMGERRDEPGYYPPTGFTLSGLELRRVDNVEEGRNGEIMIVRRAPAPTGRIYRHAAPCD